MQQAFLYPASGRLRLVTFLAAILCVQPAQALGKVESRVQLRDLDSSVMEKTVPVSVLTPEGVDVKKQSLPLVIQLHGGGSSRNELFGYEGWLGEMFGAGILEPLVVVMFSTDAFSGFLGDWEKFIIDELPVWMAQEYNTRTDREGTVITGISMGGFGSLKSAFRTPERFLAVGALEAAIEPTLTSLPARTRNSWNSMDPNFLLPEDKPTRIAHDNAEAIRASGLEIYLEVGDEDFINLHDGNEYLHRILWDHDIRHEYHLVRWADHTGASLQPRYKEMMAFLGKALAGGRHDPVELPITREEQAILERTTERMQAGERPTKEYADYMGGPRGPTLNAHFWNPLRELADDPDMQRAYATMPPTSFEAYKAFREQQAKEKEETDSDRPGTGM